MIYKLDLKQTAAPITNKPVWSLQTTANHTVKLLELKISIGQAVASEFSLGLASTVGTQTGGATAVDVSDLGTPGVSTSSLAVAWSADPGIPAKYVEGVSLQNVIGSMVYWPFPDGGLFVPPSSELVLWNTATITTANIIHISATFEEN